MLDNPWSFVKGICLIVGLAVCIFYVGTFVLALIDEFYIFIKKRGDKKLYERLKREIEGPYIADKVMMEAVIKSQDDHMKAMEYAFNKRMNEMSMDAYGRTCDEMHNERITQFLIDLALPERFRNV